MAKMKRISKGSKGRNDLRKTATLDLCRFDTKRLRAAMGRSDRRSRGQDPDSADTAADTNAMFRRWRTRDKIAGRFKKKLDGKFRAAAASFIRVLSLCANPAAHGVTRDYCRELSNSYEREIWEMQQRAGCKIRDTEVVARDLEIEGKPGEADRIRRSATRPRTPKKRGAHVPLSGSRRRRRA